MNILLASNEKRDVQNFYENCITCTRVKSKVKLHYL